MRRVAGMVAIFTYGFDQAKENFQEAKCNLTTLTDYDSLLQQALDALIYHPKTTRYIEDLAKKPRNMERYLRNECPLIHESKPFALNCAILVVIQEILII
jgi:hypothetical protein